MNLVSNQVKSYMESSSWIRKMFEHGIELKNKYGKENVYDFSLGNPDLPPPEEVGSALKEIAAAAGSPFALGYMPNAGYPETRETLAEYLSTEQGVKVPASNVIATCGAAGAINTLFRAILEPDDEVICPAPYFVEYGFYAGNFGGKLVPVKSKPLTFELNIAAMEAAFTEKTKAVIVNSPNNPTGQIYSRQELEALAELIRQHSKKTGRVIYLISDEPYRFLNYDDIEIPSLFDIYKYTVIVGSFSKSLSLAGARIGYLAVNPAIENPSELLNGIVMTNRILGYVNAPAIAQKILISCIGSQVDVNIYRQRRDAMAAVLNEAGIEYSMPRGAFYFFPKSPVADENKFIEALMEEKILAVPGRGFGYPGYFRLTFCIDEDTIKRSAEGFKRAVSRFA
ncbi:pyridoxal phosphate-dependent aminotransferase [Lentisphaerota bacterium ZTH]|nr:pyridoxal phosphate-dependent aminotransferase [Lentisphaerota bacterium]WET06813.1 pyridoxal phosphate-dependent aminotransferase [Lentisphaerota bacterium ZTH]